MNINEIREKVQEIKIARFRKGDFVKRKEHINLWKKLFFKWPNQITFLYGPKSCGKTTLLEYVRDSLLKREKIREKITFFWYELREQSFTSYKGVLNILFPIKSGKEKHENIKLFTITKQEKEKLLSQEILPFEIMNRQIEQEIEKNRKVVIVIDELQSLKGIYIDDEKMLFQELINYFVRITKVEHKAQVILVTSNAYFIEEIFTDTKLEGAAEFVFLDYLDDAEVYAWLLKRKFEEKEIEYILDKVGGYNWLLMQIIMRKKKNEDWQQLIKNAITQSKGKVITAVNHIEDTKFKQKVIVALKQLINNKGEQNLAFGSFDRKVLDFLIENEIVFYDPVNAKLKIQFRPFYYGIKHALSEYQGTTEEEEWFPD